MGLEPVASQGTSKYFNAKECIERYIDYRLEIAGDKKDLTIRSRKDLADTLQREAKTKQMLGSLVATIDIEAHQSYMAGTVIRMIDSIPGRIKRAVPEASAQVISAVQREAKRIKNAYINMLDYEPTELGPDDPMYPEDKLIQSPPPEELIALNKVADRYKERDMSLDGDEDKEANVDMAMFG